MHWIPPLSSSFAVLLCLLSPLSTTSIQAQEVSNAVLIDDGTPARIFPGDQPPPENWNARDFDDSAAPWRDGSVPLGYGETVAVEPAWDVLSDMQNNYVTVYVRVPFEVPPGQELEELQFSARFDDGIIAYVDGIEIARASLPAGNVDRSTVASSHEYTDSELTATVTAETLGAPATGRHVLAVEVHNTAINSSDLIFWPGVTATLRSTGEPVFVRGADCDGRPKLNVSDVIHILRWRFAGAETPACQKACDLNDDGAADVSDAIRGLEYIFLASPALPPPFPGAGVDPTPDELPCEG